MYYYSLCKYILSKEINNKEKFSFVNLSLKTPILMSFFFCVKIFFNFFQKNSITTLIFFKKMSLYNREVKIFGTIFIKP